MPDTYDVFLVLDILTITIHPRGRDKEKKLSEATPNAGTEMKKFGLIDQ